MERQINFLIQKMKEKPRNHIVAVSYHDSQTITTRLLHTVS